MATFREYTNIIDLRQNYSGTTSNTDDTFWLDCIRIASDWIDKICHRSFAPFIETRKFDVPSGRELRLDRDLLEITGLLNGEGTNIPSTEYNFYPANRTPHHAIRLKKTSQVFWLTDINANDEQVIAIAGVWGYHNDYSNAWQNSTATLAAAIVNATDTTFTAPTGKLKAGWLVKIDSEYLYLSSIAAGSPNDTITCVRGVNGSTAASHLISTPIYYWSVDSGLAHVCKIGAYALVKLRDNPEGEMIIVDGIEFKTLKDVDQFVAKQLATLALIRHI